MFANVVVAGYTAVTFSGDYDRVFSEFGGEPVTGFGDLGSCASQQPSCVEVHIEIPLKDHRIDVKGASQASCKHFAVVETCLSIHSFFEIWESTLEIPKRILKFQNLLYTNADSQSGFPRCESQSVEVTYLHGKKDGHLCYRLRIRKNIKCKNRHFTLFREQGFNECKQHSKRPFGTLFKGLSRFMLRLFVWFKVGWLWIND